MAVWRAGRLEGRKGRRLESWKVGRQEGWKVGRLEGWKVKMLEGWKVGSCIQTLSVFKRFCRFKMHSGARTKKINLFPQKVIF